MFSSTKAWISNRHSSKYNINFHSSRLPRKKREEVPHQALSKSPCPLETGTRREESLQPRRIWKEIKAISASIKLMPSMDQMGEAQFRNRRAPISSSQPSTQATTWTSIWAVAAQLICHRAPMWWQVAKSWALPLKTEIHLRVTSSSNSKTTYQAGRNDINILDFK